jgi:hypothetical protein
MSRYIYISEEYYGSEGVLFSFDLSLRIHGATSPNLMAANHYRMHLDDP